MNIGEIKTKITKLDCENDIIHKMWIYEIVLIKKGNTGLPRTCTHMSIFV